MDKFNYKLEKIIKICEEEIEKRKNDIYGESTLEQLERVVLPEMYQLCDLIKVKNLPNKEERFIKSFANAFTIWGWNMKNPTKLFILLKELNDEYKEL